ncbi:TetR/AcrR family transcriptional repressor of nem operon [Angulomicrobium tetraedrale]|uniref:TetR/AcrR family transcriptional repressor of nem operon n=1 Tax=Ancylobacter tetraedralis TaxID=217068 RepID=A0A839ZBR8_9HYPH|nr:TetR/AcrR family transcriptional regulator [Ancylobacter tetraedralis]MBB3772155.1 TetR/AcrR family transcriptional repressor of nem operon [Ancylobacter tetraedralis]
MEAKIPTRDRIVAAGRKAMLEQGYEGTGIGPLLASVAVPKGSFYHFFASKEAFAGAVLAAYADHYRQIRQALFADAGLSPMIRLERHLEHLERETMSEEGVAGCLYGVLALAAPGLGAELRGQLGEVFAAWEGDLAAVIAEAQQAGEADGALDPREAAAYVIDAYEGAVIRARAGDAPAAFARFRRFTLATLRGGAARADAVG